MPLDYPDIEPPYPVPDTCAVTPLEGPYVWREYPGYWLVGDGMRVGTSRPFIFTDGTKLYWQLSVRGEVDFHAQRIDGASGEMVDGLSGISGGAVGEDIRSGVSFPSAGCWQIDATAGEQSLAATIYVFPDACNALAAEATPEADRAPCVPPEA